MTYNEHELSTSLARIIAAGELLSGNGEWQHLDPDTKKLLIAARNSVSELGDRMTDMVKAKLK
jgi:signal transduction histidine kinase